MSDRAPFVVLVDAAPDQAAMLVPRSDQFEEDARFRLIFSHISEIIEDQAVDTVELGQEGRQGEIALGGLQALRQVVRADRQDAESSLDEAVSDACCGMAQRHQGHGFERLDLPLPKVFLGIYLMTDKQGISAMALAWLPGHWSQRVCSL